MSATTALFSLKLTPHLLVLLSKWICFDTLRLTFLRESNECSVWTFRCFRTKKQEEIERVKQLIRSPKDKVVVPAHAHEDSDDFEESPLVRSAAGPSRNAELKRNRRRSAKTSLPATTASVAPPPPRDAQDDEDLESIGGYTH